MRNRFFYTICFLITFQVTVFAQHTMTNWGSLNFHMNAEITLFGNFNNEGSFFDTSGFVNFQGGATQTISGTIVPIFNNCTLNNVSGVELAQSITVKNTIHLMSGSLVLNSNTLLVLNSDPIGITRVSGNIVSEQTDNSGKVTWCIGT